MPGDDVVQKKSPLIAYNSLHTIAVKIKNKGDDAKRGRDAALR